MRRLIVLIAIVLAGLTGPTAALADPLVPKSQARINAEKAYQEEIRRQDEALEQAIEEDNARHEEMRKQNADRIRDAENNIDQWIRDNPAPRGTLVRRIISYDWETALVDNAAVTWTDRHGMTTHRIEFGPDGQPTGPLELTQQGKVAEKIKNEWPEDGSTARYSYGETPEGEQIITNVTIADSEGYPLLRLWFNSEGVAWQGIRWDPETGERIGTFRDEKLQDPPETFGGPLHVPEIYRLITQPCEPCRAATEAYNDLANAWNTRVAELRELSDRHQKSYPRAQIPIRMRHEHLMGELAAMKAQIEAARKAALECDCGKQEEPDDAQTVVAASDPVEVDVPPPSCEYGSGPVCDYISPNSCIEGGDLGCDYEPTCTSSAGQTCQYTYSTDLVIPPCTENICDPLRDGICTEPGCDWFQDDGCEDAYCTSPPSQTCAEGALCEPPQTSSCADDPLCEPVSEPLCVFDDCDPVRALLDCTGSSCDQLPEETCTTGGTDLAVTILPEDKGMRIVLEMHNEDRAKFGLPPLRWSLELAVVAQAHAEREARTGAGEHSSLADRTRLNFGENMSIGVRSKITAPGMFQLWLDEGELFNPDGAFPNICIEVEWSECGHVSQVRWSATVEVGCGYAVEVYVVLICNYSPPGNMFGQKALGPPPAAPTQVAVNDPCPAPAGHSLNGSIIAAGNAPASTSASGNPAADALLDSRKAEAQRRYLEQYVQNRPASPAAPVGDPMPGPAIVANDSRPAAVQQQQTPKPVATKTLMIPHLLERGGTIASKDTFDTAIFQTYTAAQGQLQQEEQQQQQQQFDDAADSPPRIDFAITEPDENTIEGNKNVELSNWPYPDDDDDEKRYEVAGTTHIVMDNERDRELSLDVRQEMPQLLLQSSPPNSKKIIGSDDALNEADKDFVPVGGPAQNAISNKLSSQLSPDCEETFPPDLSVFVFEPVPLDGASKQTEQSDSCTADAEGALNDEPGSAKTPQPPPNTDDQEPPKTSIMDEMEKTLVVP